MLLSLSLNDRYDDIVFCYESNFDSLNSIMNFLCIKSSNIFRKMVPNFDKSGGYEYN